MIGPKVYSTLMVSLSTSLLVAFSLVACPASHAQEAATAAKKITAIIDLPNEQIDYLDVTISLHAMVDPELDSEAVRAQIDDILADIERMLENEPKGDGPKLRTLRQYLYDPGEWNDEVAFSYDQNDPLGTHIPNKLLHNYLDSRLGNCVSMPVLHLILADRLGLEVSLSTAPNHVFVKYHAPDGRKFNIEITSGGHPARDAWYVENFGISDKARSTGLFLKTLSRRETAAVIASVVMEHYAEEGLHGSVTHISDTLLRNYPQFDAAHIHRGLAFQFMLQTNFLTKYTHPGMIPQEDISALNFLAREADKSFDTVEYLGYITSAD